MSGKSRGRYRSARSPHDDGARGSVESEEEGFRTRKRVREKHETQFVYHERRATDSTLDYIYCPLLDIIRCEGKRRLNIVFKPMEKESV